MSIVSRFNKNAGSLEHYILDADFNGTPFFVGVTIGTCQDGIISSQGQKCMKRLTVIQRAKTDSKTYTMTEIRKSGEAAFVVAKRAARAERHDALMFFCATEECFQEVLDALNIQVPK